MENIQGYITRIIPELIEIRKELHRIPELGFSEYKTAKKVEAILAEIGCEVATGVGGTGVIGLLRGKKNGPTIALRACLDALEIDEDSGLAYKSEHHGRMHACGHDGNMAIVIGTAKVLSMYRERLNGNVKFLFQPSEENTGGAAAIIQAGGLKNPDVGAIITPHNWHGIPQASIVIKSGAMLASSDIFRLKVIGKPGHGAWPHLAVDPIPVAAEIILKLQTIVSREIDPLKSAAISIGKIHGGTAVNIIGDSVVMEGTVRTLDPDLRNFIEKRIKEVIGGLTQASRASYELDYQRVMPPVKNDPELTGQVRELLSKVFDGNVLTDALDPSMGCEEFSLFQEKIPGIFMFIGNDKPGEEVIPIHSPKYIFNDAILSNGIKALAEIAFWYTGSIN